MNAKFAGTCSITGEHFDAGTEIVNVGKGYAIARYTTLDGITEWMAAHHAAAIVTLTEAGAEEKVFVKLERIYGRHVAQTLESWASPTISRPTCTRNWADYDVTVTLEASRARRNAQAA